PERLRALCNLGWTLLGAGDLARAGELLEFVLESRSLHLPDDDGGVQLAGLGLARVRRAQGDEAGARALIVRLLGGLERRARLLAAESGRVAREAARGDLAHFVELLQLAATLADSAGLQEALFRTLAQFRVASRGGPGAAVGVAELASARKELHDLAASPPLEADAVELWRQEILRLSEERDRIERDLRRAHPEDWVEVDPGTLARSIGAGGAAASFLRYPREVEGAHARVESLLAFVVRADGVVLRVELGPVAPIEDLVTRWRESSGRALHGRGLGVATAPRDDALLARIGAELRALVLDPVLVAAGQPQSLHVELDDVLYLVPLDALPTEGGWVGERLRIHTWTTFASLVRPAVLRGKGDGLLVLGGIDYDAEPGEALELGTTTPPSEPGQRGAAGASLPALPGTERESAEVGAIFAQAFGREPVRLAGAAATKTALFRHAPAARFLHLATHGWYAGEALRSELDSLAVTASSQQRALDVLLGFAPETLCGLALAGANRGRDVLGQLPGILTAEELTVLDLRAAELVVLSACETNVGLRRSGQGILSLQTAVHAAGARSAITSLWAVDDAATVELFGAFYRALWSEGVGKAEALWRAKTALRNAGRPACDWAGWVLSGAPQ
ncbi:MAG: CHAT domain-containing protein, partial [Planctomycetota bacterium]